MRQKLIVRCAYLNTQNLILNSVIKTQKGNPKDEAIDVEHCRKAERRIGRQSAVGGKQLAVSTKVKLRLQTENSKLHTKIKSCSSVWLEHYTDNVGVSSSNLLGTTKVSQKSKGKSQKMTE